jgi:sigma-B regulation protein RsbU (phosphoserine phosphatase)
VAAWRWTATPTSRWDRCSSTSSPSCAPPGPDRTILAAIDLDGPVDCDRIRIGQLLSNLLANALTHGAADRPVTVRAEARSGVFELSVANAGEPIPPAMAKRLFLPFFRGAGRPSRQGLGLGLYIASEIARAHGGALDVASTAQETRFTFRMPLPLPVALPAAADGAAAAAD